MSKVAQIIERIQNLTDAQLRQEVFALPATGETPPAPYPHQVTALANVEAGSTYSPPVGGIIHFPTGAGKTRVGLEVIARELRRRDPGSRRTNHRFAWVTARKQLLRQTMERMVEQASSFPAGTKFTWADGADNVDFGKRNVDVIFMTQHTLRDAFGEAARSTKHPWRQLLEYGDALTVIYDECHQLGAAGLQTAWKKFHDKVIPGQTGRNRFRAIGLSATPVPTSADAHDLLASRIFPIRQSPRFDGSSWPFHVFHRVDNSELIKQKVLCPLNMVWDEAGVFDIPTSILAKQIGDSRVKPPRRGAGKDELILYAQKFNKCVMGSEPVVRFLAHRIASRIEALGKTIVFVPNIEAANMMVDILDADFRSLRGRVAAVHSRMRELRIPGQGSSVHEVLHTFRSLGTQPSILINVDMLTEGFDDPKIQTVVLGRLTLSTNRFWQMIGRGTRGPKAGGTDSCNVIDPVKLVRLYDYFGGYQPTVLGDTDVENEGDEDEPGDDALSPKVPSISLPPSPSVVKYQVDPELEARNRRVAEAIRHFLRGGTLAEDDAVSVAKSVQVSLKGEKPSIGNAVPAAATSNFEQNAQFILNEQVQAVQKRMGVDLSWFIRRSPHPLPEDLFRQQLRYLEAVERLGIRNEVDLFKAEQSGEWHDIIRRKATGGAGAEVPAQRTAPEAAVMATCMAVAAADGRITEDEREATAAALHQLFGRAIDDDLRREVRGATAPAVIPLADLAGLHAADKERLVRHLVNVAAADGIIVPEERSVVRDVAQRLNIGMSRIEQLLGEEPQSVATAPGRGECASCGATNPAQARFCMGCGSKIESPMPPAPEPPARHSLSLDLDGRGGGTLSQDKHTNKVSASSQTPQPARQELDFDMDGEDGGTFSEEALMRHLRQLHSSRYAYLILRSGEGKLIQAVADDSPRGGGTIVEWGDDDGKCLYRFRRETDGGERLTQEEAAELFRSFARGGRPHAPGLVERDASMG